MTLKHFECPATCELCSYWIPNHSSDCPRSGVHPSQWSMDTPEIMEEDEEDNSFDFEEN
ncbi:hypothetical protein A0J61_11052 [Choanephora cucurbitarum]|uniref:Uncharacterized protein n=1 Tax=Choanephora cucurbitarum TaxID=101091 RepID=A0A1C7MWT4_9FUNG|nr:hypothetical protein A0J61_11052 [Choanephora cucurbitarum]